MQLRFIHIAFLTLFILPLWNSFALDPNTQFNKPTKSKYDIDKRKKLGLLRHPKKNNPKSQLAYANKLMKDNYKKALKAYTALVKTWPVSDEAPIAQIHIAEILELQAKPEHAFKEYQYLIKYYSGKFDYNDILTRQIKLANDVMLSTYNNFLWFKHISKEERAIPMFKKITQNAPTWERTPEAYFKIGVINEDLKSINDAITAYKKIITSYPSSKWTKKAAYRLSICLFKLAEKNPRDEKKSLEAINAFSTYLSMHPDKDLANEVQSYLDKIKLRLAKKYRDKAEYYDKIKKNPKAAIICYEDLIKTFPNYKDKEKIIKRISKLRKEMESNND